MTTERTAADRPADARKWWVLIALALSVLVVGIDLTVLSVALPTIGPALHATTADLQWFVDSYSLVLAAALLPAGVLGDRLGRKNVLVIGLALFGVTSAACAYCTGSGSLIAARAVLGLAAAAIVPLAMAVLPIMFTPDERPKAMAVVMTATMLGYPLGPVLGGWLLTRFWWGSVFLINVPVVLLAVLAVVLLMPPSADPGVGRFDTLGAAVSSAGLVGITYGVVEAGSRGWSAPAGWGPLAGGLLLLGLFVLRERRVARDPHTEPLADLGLFRSRHFTWGTVLATIVSFALFGLMFAMPLYFQDVAGSDSMLTGIKMLPLIGGLVVGGAIGARLQTPRARPDGERRAVAGIRPIVAAGFLLIALGLGLGARTGDNTGEGYAATWFVIIGLGLGLALPTASNAALGALERERSGVGSALIQALRQVGGTIGVALLGSILGSVYRDRLGSTPAAAATPAEAATEAGQSVTSGVQVARESGDTALLTAVRDAYVHAMDSTLLVCAALAVAGMVLAVLFLPGRTRAGAPVPSPRPLGPDGGDEAREHPEEESVAGR